MKTIIVDDEPPARALLREYLEDAGGVEIADECGTGRAALEAINAVAPDLVFLDVQMPGWDGFDVLERLEHLPQIIFSTAHDDFAVRAFEAGAADYLLKPYSRARFRTALKRARARHRQGAEPAGTLLGVLQAARGGAHPERLFVRAGRRIVPVDTAAIRWIEADGDYAKLHTAAGTHLHSAGLGALADRLDPARFLRVHRSAIIALPALRHLVSDGQGGYVAAIDVGDRGQKKVRVSRTYAPAVRNLLG